YVRDVEVAGSNPVSPTKNCEEGRPFGAAFFVFPFSRFAGEGARRADEGSFCSLKQKAGPHPNPASHPGPREGARAFRDARASGSQAHPLTPQAGEGVRR